MKKISVIIPAYNEEKNIKKVVTDIITNPLVDEIIVVNNNSTDKTAQIVESIESDQINLLFCKEKGKGYAMECGIAHAKNDYILFADADICNYSDCFINDMVSPLLNDDYDFVKSTFEREGGRVTELVAKPLLELTFPKLIDFDQPLSGVIAGKRELLKSIQLEKDYGVDIGILIDIYKMDAKMIQVNIGKIDNDSQDWKDLTFMAKQVSRTILTRANDGKGNYSVKIFNQE